MRTLLVTLHVLTAMFFVGPLALAPFAGLQAIVRRDCAAVRRASRATVVLTLAAAVVLLSGLAATRHSENVSYGTPWVTISITLSSFATVTLLVVAAPALRSVAVLLESDGVVVGGRGRARLETLRGRILATAILAGTAWAVVVVMMTVKPFG